jgi:hypothetical protein
VRSNAQQHESGPLTHGAFPSLLLSKSCLSVLIDNEKIYKKFSQHVRHVLGAFITTPIPHGSADTTLYPCCMGGLV